MNYRLALGAVKTISIMARANHENMVLSPDSDFFATDCDKAIIEALDKQIGKTVLIRPSSDQEYIDYCCPHCETVLQQKHKTPPMHETGHRYKCCPECGQKLVWETKWDTANDVLMKIEKGRTIPLVLPDFFNTKK